MRSYELIALIPTIAVLVIFFSARSCEIETRKIKAVGDCYWQTSKKAGDVEQICLRLKKELGLK